MRALFVLTPAESKRLIAKAIAEMDEVKRAKKNGKILIGHGSTNVFVAEEILGKENVSELWRRESYLSGVILRGTLCTTLGEEKPPILVLNRGVVEPPALTMDVLLRDFGRSGVVTIAAVNGLAFGGGCELAMACDVRVAARSALFGQPEIKLGIIPGFGGTQRLPRLVGENKALEMNLIGDPVGAEEAFDFGLVNRVVTDHELLDTAVAWARRLAEQAPLAVQAIKDASAKGDLDEGIEAEKAAFLSVFASNDGREGIGAFLGKRKPQWTGT